MNCPTCSAKTLVLETRGVRRVRRCSGCGARWATEERVLAELPGRRGRPAKVVAPRAARPRVERWDEGAEDYDYLPDTW